jgi:ParB/RepB/Spo0J family partition protein
MNFMSTAAPVAARVPLDAITPSSTNPRKHFDEVKLAELAESIKRNDVVQAILVRPAFAPGSYELVAGERRWRAARLAGLLDIPVTVRELTDGQVREIQIVENLNREDLHELEEAEGYEQLMACGHDDGTKYPIDEIAAKVGKSKAYVYGRLKLLDLCEAGRQALRDGAISASTALLIARIPVPKLQEKCLNEILDPDYGSEPMSFRDAKSHVEDRYMLRLKEAPFKTKDTTLVPEAGSCTDCQKRTGNQPELFADIAAADVCTDPDCFDRKRKAHVTAERDRAKASGQPVIVGKEAKKIYPWEHSPPAGYVRLDDRCPADAKERHWRAVLGKALKPSDVFPGPTLVERPGDPGKFVECVTLEFAQAAIKVKGMDVKAATQDHAPGQMSDEERERQAATQELEREVRMRLYRELRASIAQQGIDAEAARAMLAESMSMFDADDDVLRLWGLTEEQLEASIDVQDLIAAAPARELVPMLFDCIFSNFRYRGEGWEHLLEGRGIDRKAITREVKAEQKSKAKALKPTPDPAAVV